MSLPSLQDLKKLRKKIGLTQNDLAERAEVSQPLIARIESKDVDPRYSTFKKIYEALIEAKKEKMVASDVMSSPVISISCEEEVRKAIEIMRETDISQLPVVENDVPVGSISEENIVHQLENSATRDVSSKKVNEVMNSSFPTVSTSTDVNAIIGMLEYSPAVLVTKKGKLVGVITKQDIIKVVEGSSE
ncbi:MAG: putative transcriptional regulator with C-terminal CBS domain [Candidatus Methanohalarchaeum thermophilum]|uniref:Transcriptional regulator with C-terminal CBS domain n=1 Tax=Methanohalarchaeum thermophilum TaxID=1903181 RepID=A0A1Q6DW33_METT1|nr:MAG: putative transcriptional regulator with C-terminal CBS domain [Candidatus Methanohalarchaeum thermophilum]